MWSSQTERLLLSWNDIWIIQELKKDKWNYNKTEPWSRLQQLPVLTLPWQQPSELTPNLEQSLFSYCRRWACDWHGQDLNF